MSRFHFCTMAQCHGFEILGNLTLSGIRRRRAGFGGVAGLGSGSQCVVSSGPMQGRPGPPVPQCAVPEIRGEGGRHGSTTQIGALRHCRGVAIGLCATLRRS